MVGGILAIVTSLLIFVIGAALVIAVVVALWRMAQAQTEIAQALHDLAAQQQKQP